VWSEIERRAATARAGRRRRNVAEARDASDVLEHVADSYADSNGFDKPSCGIFYADISSRIRGSGCS
jgi:hypothetical protein